jgi:transposase-like protein
MEDFLRFEGQNEIDFLNRFSDKDACNAYLAHYKWKDGFVCHFCGCKEEYKCNRPHHKRCKNCQKQISPTMNTLFHKVKFGIEKAFYVILKMSGTTKSISAEQLSKSIGVNRKTALLFQQKVRIAMQSSELYPLDGQVEVDEAFIGQKEEGYPGRGAEQKAQIVVAVEKNGATGVKRMYARRIENANAASLKVIFEKQISEKATVLTDKWKGYSPLSELYNIAQEKSEPDKNFKVMHRCIQQLKSWIRGIHHSVSHDYLQGYLDEFCYRINRSIHKETIFDNLLQRMVFGSQVTKKQIKFAYVI